MKSRKIIPAVLLLALCLALTGCRTRTGLHGQAGLNEKDGQADIPAPLSEALPDGEPEGDTDEQEKSREPGGSTRENPAASRKEYDENRPAEILPGAEKTVHGSGEGNGFGASGEDPDPPAARLNENVEKTATRTVPADEAEQTGVSEEAEKADSAVTYYTVLLQDRTSSLFECQRLNIYWETGEDHVTIFRTSPEHQLILDAGAYDVSARLLEGNLHVDDGWIGRKNPDLVVKVTDRSVLGTGVLTGEGARRAYTELLARDGWQDISAVRNRRVLLISEEVLEAPHLQLAAKLAIAKMANPDLYADVDPGQALAMLGEETTGSVPNGIYFYNGQGGFS